MDEQSQQVVSAGSVTAQSDCNQLQNPTRRRTARLKAALSDRQVISAKPREKPYKLTDGNGLYLLIKPNGSKLWHWKYRFNASEKLLPLGPYPITSLAEARQGRDAARVQLARGLDPMELRKVAKLAQKVAATNSFRSVAQAWWDQWRPHRTERHAGHVWRRFEVDVFPLLGSRPISQVQPSDLRDMIKRIDKRGAHELARRALQSCSMVFRYALAHDLVTRNPANDIKAGDVLGERRKVNMARVDATEFPKLLRDIEAYEGASLTRLAIKLMALTFVRTSELIGARWEEFDLVAARWTIPASRMKMRTLHIVPLSSQAVEVLRILQTVSGTRDHVFPGSRNPRGHMSNNTILMALERMGYRGKMTGHGFRGVASTILHELDYSHACIEAQLAHQERNAVSAAYNHATYLPQRIKMMQDWADRLDAMRSGKVIHGEFRNVA